MIIYQLPSGGKQQVIEFDAREDETMETTLHLAGSTLEEVAKEINPVVRGWINYYGKFYTSKLKTFMREVNLRIVKWARSKYLKSDRALKRG